MANIWHPVEDYHLTLESDYERTYPSFSEPHSFQVPENPGRGDILSANDYHSWYNRRETLTVRPTARQSEGDNLSRTDPVLMSMIMNGDQLQFQQDSIITSSAPVTLDVDDRRVPLGNTEIFHAHGALSTGLMPPHSTMNGETMPPLYNTSPSATPPSRTDETTINRRGAEIEGIKKRRKKAASFFCPVGGCNSVGFTASSSLNRHVKDKHTGKQHLCSVCSHAFADSTSVGRHERDKHQRPYNQRSKKDIYQYRIEY